MSVSIAGKQVGSIGYGLMGLTAPHKPHTVEECIEVMKAALEAGDNYFNAGEFYGTPDYNSLHVLKAYFTKYPEDADKVVLNVKGALDVAKWAPDCTPEGIQKSVDNCLRILDGTKKIDIFECARVDPKVPVETSIAALADLVKAGKIGAIGLSEVTGDTIRRAAKIHPIANVEIELSVWATDPITNGTLATCAELGIPVAAYGPLGHGFLTGKVKSPEDLGPFQRTLPRFQPDVFDEHLKLVRELETIASTKGCTSGQIAIAWVEAQGRKPGMPQIITLPGSSTVARLQENSKHIELSDQDLAEIDEILERVEIKGGRYAGEQATYIDA